MARKKREHTADEFGRPGSGSSAIGGVIDGPMIGAGSAIMADALVEKESGTTPGPPLISVKTLAVILVVMFLAGFAYLMALEGSDPIPVGRHEGLWLDFDPAKGIDVGSRLELMTDPIEDDEVTTWRARTDAGTTYYVEGRQVTLPELEAVLGGPDGVVVEVESSEPGTIDRLGVSILGLSTGSY